MRPAGRAVADRSNNGRAVELRGVTATRAGLPVWHDATIAIEKGEFVAVLGPNGSGKSTLLDLLLGLLRPAAGTETVPAAGRSSPSSRSSSVDLPDPFGPSTATNSPFSMAMVASCQTGRPARVAVTPRNSTARPLLLLSATALPAGRIVQGLDETAQLGDLPLLEARACRVEGLGHRGDRDAATAGDCVDPLNVGRGVLAVVDPDLDQALVCLGVDCLLVLGADLRAFGDRLGEAVGRQQLEPE